MVRRWQDEEGNFLLQDFGEDNLLTFFRYYGSDEQGNFHLLTLSLI
jgi:hypothetical protein